MADMIVRLYDLADKAPITAALKAQDVVISRAKDSDKSPLLAWLSGDFEVWKDEVGRAFGARTITCFVAKVQTQIVGFAAYDVACRNFFGPTGVGERYRGRGVGTGLLLSALHAQKEEGYAYAIIGGVGPAEFYTHTVDAQLIAHSTPGIYRS